MASRTLETTGHTYWFDDERELIRIADKIVEDGFIVLPPDHTTSAAHELPHAERIVFTAHIVALS